MWAEIREERGQIRRDLLNCIVFFFLFWSGKVLKGVVSEKKQPFRNKEKANRRTQC